jgi:ABC-type bacteriocin/lantibiotic exporter with double-glycine peptidase domain
MLHIFGGLLREDRFAVGCVHACQRNSQVTSNPGWSGRQRHKREVNTVSIKKARLQETLSTYLRVFRFWSVLQEQYGRLARLLGVRIAAVLLNMTLPLFTRYLIDHVLAKHDTRGLLGTGAIFTAVVLASLLLMVLISFSSAQLDVAVSFRLRRAVQRKWEKVSLGYFNRWGVGEHIYRATADVDNVRVSLLRIPIELLITAMEFCIFFCIAAWLNIRLTLIFSCSLPVVLLIDLLYAKRIRPVQQVLQGAAATLNSHLGEFVSGITSSKVYSCEHRLGRRMLRRLIALARQSMQKWRIDTVAQTSRWFVTAGFGWLVFFVGLAMVMRGRFTLGSLIALRMYLTGLEKPISEIGELVQSLPAGSVSADRLINTLSAPEEQFAAGSFEHPVHSGAAIEIQNLIFSYDDGKPLLAGLSAQIDSGQFIGITGPSGVGKTTLTALMARLYEPLAGTIRFDGVDIRSLARDELRRSISIVPQDSHMFAGSIRENIAYGDPTASFEEIVRAARLADAHEFILAQKNGYDTAVGGPVAALSAGQRQRIAIARALLKKSRLVILDEAMSALDAESRLRILQSVRQLLSQRTVLLITHDPGLLMQCDSVLLLVEGKATKHTPHELAAEQSAFYEYLVLKSIYEGVTPALEHANGNGIVQRKIAVPI